MGAISEQNISLDGEVSLAEAKHEAMEKLLELKRTLEYYGKNRSLYINMNGAQGVLNKQEIIEHFRNSPVLFHKTSNKGNSETLDQISVQGLTTLDFRSRKEEIFPTPKMPVVEEGVPDKPYTEDDMWADLYDQEYQMDNAWRSIDREYNHKYISLSFIPWWNVHRIDEGEPVSKHGHVMSGVGQVELGLVSIALDESESKKIIDRNCEELERDNPDSEFNKIVNDRTVAFAEALEPLRIAPKHIAAIFLMEGKSSDIFNEVERDQFQNEVNKLGLKFKTPIFNFYGDLLWPKELNNEDVLILIEERNNQT